MYKHILFPTDGSIASEDVRAHAVALAKQFNAKVTILHAYEFLEVLPIYETAYAYIDELEEYLEVQSAKITQSAAEAFTAEGIEVSSISVKGEPGYSIVSMANELKADVVIMGSRGLGAFQRFLMGSVSQYVLHHSTSPVLLIPPKDKDA